MRIAAGATRVTGIVVSGRYGVACVVNNRSGVTGISVGYLEDICDRAIADENNIALLEIIAG